MPTYRVRIFMDIVVDADTDVEAADKAWRQLEANPPTRPGEFEASISRTVPGETPTPCKDTEITREIRPQVTQ